MRLFYQGHPWTYGSIAAHRLADRIGIHEEDIEGVAFFRDIWDAIDTGGIAIVPIENSHAWSVHENLYGFLEHDVRIVDEVRLDIHHCLLSRETDITQVRTVYSHPQALSQCRLFIQNHGFRPMEMGNTASAAKKIADEDIPWTAAIASRECADLYHLNVLQEYIEDHDGNTTRFLVVTRDADGYPSHTHRKVTLLFETADVPAALYKCLGAFATNHINFSKIESLPSTRNPFAYYFWVDFEGTLVDTAVVKAMQELSFFTNFIKVLGEY